MEVTVNLVDRADIDVPSILYKYRNWNDPFHKTILSLQTVFMAAPSTFEDKLEFRNFKRYELMTDEEIYQKYIWHSKYNNPHFTEQQHHEYASYWTKQTPLKDVNIVTQHHEQFYREYDKRIGVLSLTEYNDAKKMWDKYASNGSGFCIGLYSKILFDQFKGKGQFGKVNYPKEGLPVINGTDDFNLETWKRVFNKETKWECEQEYRTTIFSLDGLIERRIRLPIECIREVIFGWNMTTKIRLSIIKICKRNNLSVTYYQAIRGNDPIQILKCN